MRLVLLLLMFLSSEVMLQAAPPVSTKGVDQARRLLLRSAVGKKIMAVGAAVMLLSGSAALSAEQVETGKKESTSELVSVYIGMARDYLPESSGAYITDIDGVAYRRFGDYHGQATTIDEWKNAFAFGTGLHFGRLELKGFFFASRYRAKAPQVRVPKNIYRGEGFTGGAMLAATYDLFSLREGKLVVPSKDAPLKFAAGLSVNFHVVGNAINDSEKEGIINNQLAPDNQHYARGATGVGVTWQADWHFSSVEVGGSNDNKVWWGLTYIGNITTDRAMTHYLLTKTTF